MTPLSIIKALSATNSRTDKEQILFDAYMNDHREFFIGARLACDPLVSFGVAKAALIEDEDDALGIFTFEDFLSLTMKLRKRELTGHAARDAIIDAAQRCHAPTWNHFYRRIILKDLKCGVEEKTINKVLNKVAGSFPEARDLMIPVFACQLAHDGAKPEHGKKIKGKKMLDVKLDGARLLTVLDKETNTVTQFTGRNGKMNENFSEVRDALSKVMEQLPGSVVLDGEIISTSFQDLMTQINRREGVDTSAARYAMFDILPLSDFRAGICRTPQAERHRALSALETSGLLASTEGVVYVIPKVSTDLDTPEGQEALSNFKMEAAEAGYEGVMVKDPASPYECGKRSANWLKIKPFIEVSLEVVGVEEGKPDGKYVGQLGAFFCKGEDDGCNIEVNVGSGFSDEQRVDFWARRAEIIGMIVEVRADAMSMEQGSSVYSLRFPRFKGFRGTKPGEKL